MARRTKTARFSISIDVQCAREKQSMKMMKKDRLDGGCESNRNYYELK